VRKQTDDEERWWTRPMNLDEIALPSIQDQRPGLCSVQRRPWRDTGLGIFPIGAVRVLSTLYCLEIVLPYRGVFIASIYLVLDYLLLVLFVLDTYSAVLLYLPLPQ
jgi:hypothetical protein